MKMIMEPEHMSGQVSTMEICGRRRQLLCVQWPIIWHCNKVYANLTTARRFHRRFIHEFYLGSWHVEQQKLSQQS